MRLTFSPPLAVGSLLWRPRPDAYVLTILCKATFVLKPGQTATATSPEAPATSDRPWHRETESIGIPTDLVPVKRNVDVVLIGHAYAPQRTPINSLIAGLSFATINKSILVTGDRSWEPSGTCPDPGVFVRMPLCWERAAGGPSTWNPLGIPVGARIDPQTRPRIPNLLPRGFVVQNSTHLIPTVGFGAIPPHWPGRAGYVRKWAASWNHSKWHESVLPQDLDTAYFNAAPTDQQLRELPPTTAITLDHFHPDIPRFVSFIEDLRPRAMVVRSPNAAPQELWLRADTVLIDVDRAICSITWRAAIPLRHPQEEGLVHIEPTRGNVPVSPSATSNAVLPIPNAGTVPMIPVSPKTDVMPHARLSSPERSRENDPRMSMSVDEFTTMPLRAETPNQSSPLPFRPPSPSSPPGTLPFVPQSPPHHRENAPISADGGTLLNNGAKPSVDASPLPFRPPSPNAMKSRGDDDEVTAVHAKPIPKRESSGVIKHPTPVPPPIASPVTSGTAGRNQSPEGAPKPESALPFRPVARSADDSSNARDHFATMGTSSVLPFQPPPSATTEPPPEGERLSSAPPPAPPAAPIAPRPPAPPPPIARASTPLIPPPAPGLPFQPPLATDTPAPPRERLPSVPPVGLPFVAPLGAPPIAPAPNPRSNSPGLPFQTPSAADAPPRERPPSTGGGLPFATPQASAPIAPPPAQRASSPGLPFQTPPARDNPPPRESLPSAPSIGLPFGTPLGAAPSAPVPAPQANSSGLPFQTPAKDLPVPPASRDRLSSIPEQPSGVGPTLTPAPVGLSVSTPSDSSAFVQWGRLSGSNNESPSPSASVVANASELAKSKVDRSFERYARIKAQLWAPDASRDDVLSKHGLDEIEWRILEQQQAEALELEAKEGRCDLALAVLAAFEAAQGPLLAAS